MGISKEGISDELANRLRKSGVAITDPETPFKDLGVDSHTLLELVLFLERRFGIALPDDSLNATNLESVDRLAQCAYEISESTG